MQHYFKNLNQRILIPWPRTDRDSYQGKKLYLISIQSARQMARCFINSRNDNNDTSESANVLQAKSVLFKYKLCFLNYSLFHCHGFCVVPHGTA